MRKADESVIEKIEADTTISMSYDFSECIKKYHLKPLKAKNELYSSKLGQGLEV